MEDVQGIMDFVVMGRCSSTSYYIKDRPIHKI